MQVTESSFGLTGLTTDHGSFSLGKASNRICARSLEIKRSVDRLDVDFAFNLSRLDSAGPTAARWLELWVDESTMAWDRARMIDRPVYTAFTDVQDIEAARTFRRWWSLLQFGSPLGQAKSKML